jgi:surface antigen
MRIVTLAVAMILLGTEVSAAAQLPFGLGSNSSSNKKKAGCELSEGKKRGSSIAGGLLGGLADRAFGRNPIASFVPTNAFTNALTDAIACKLDQDEQKKAVAATEQAVAGGVGSRSSWTSATRQGVSGSSTVTAANTRADGGSCMTITDVVIVEGQETTVAKQMCRKPGGGGYVLSA